MLDLLLRLAKDGKQLNHDLCDYFRHQGAQRDLGIYFEAFEKASDTFKQFEESVIARADTPGRLIYSDIRGRSRLIEMTTRTAKRTSMPTNMIFAG